MAMTPRYQIVLTRWEDTHRWHWSIADHNAGGCTADDGKAHDGPYDCPAEASIDASDRLTKLKLRGKSRRVAEAK
jgi:hypothetical protein